MTEGLMLPFKVMRACHITLSKEGLALTWIEVCKKTSIVGGGFIHNGVMQRMNLVLNCAKERNVCNITDL